MFFGIERLRETHMRMTKMSFGDAVRLIVAMMGDSYTRTSPRYVLKVAQILWRYFNSAGTAATVPPLGTAGVRLVLILTAIILMLWVHQLYSPDFPALTTQGMARIFRL
ncbi:hypothetical protein [Klebsiella pneumoniae]|uniref:hypothetical protein n=1 Tax=Klebsiella pneumoniae TaxID=573 RepID=UPI0008FB08F1|nr:hypothetical protein [Klebsiella pneumoniae]